MADPTRIVRDFISAFNANELEGAKLAAWRDYFDMSQFQRQLPGQQG